MEEIVRAFNFVIEKGWVSVWARFTPASPDLTSGYYVLLARVYRPSTGEHQNGRRSKLRRRIVSGEASQILQSISLERYSHCHPDVAEKYSLIAPIAEQCLHKYGFSPTCGVM